MPPISLRVTPIHHLAEVCVGNPYWIFNEREYNAIQSQWVCQCPRTLHTRTQPLRHIHTHLHTHKNKLSHTPAVIFEIALHLPNSVRVSALKGSCCNCVCLQQISHFCCSMIRTQQDLWASSIQISILHFIDSSCFCGNRHILRHVLLKKASKFDEKRL